MIKKRQKIYWLLGVALGITMIFFQSCKDFFAPQQELIIKEENFFRDWYDYRSAEMGLYALQQELAEQLLILGELRGDLLEVTANASRDLLEVQNFEITELNEYASPRKFYKLIAACNNLQRALEHYHPEVIDNNAPVTNYDKLYGEVIIMKSWAYFNAVRIYGKIPYIPVSQTSIEDIITFVNSPQTVLDSMDIIFNPDGYNNDTIWYNEPKKLENAWFELPDIVDSCTYQIENKVKATGVNHHLDNNDATWEVTVWNEYAMYYLLGQMYFYQGDLQKAMQNFDMILKITNLETNEVRYGLDNTFSKSKWKNIHTSINSNEHILVSWFGKSFRQTNDFQKLFSIVPPNEYQMKPTKNAVFYWETIWDNTRLLFWPRIPADMEEQALRDGYPGIPGDFYRGYNVSYTYMKDGFRMTNEEVKEMLELKRAENDFEVKKFMEGVDTVVYKYTIGKQNDPFARDANFILARAASVHLYAAEIYAYYAWFDVGGGNYQPNVSWAGTFLNDGSYQGNNFQLGVRGRVGFADNYEKIIVPDVLWKHDPYTNQVIGYTVMTGDLNKKQQYMEDMVMEERARELAYEGERFYDLIRVAKRRGDNSYLADMVASKFSGDKAEIIRARLMDEQNWYVPFYLGALE